MFKSVSILLRILSERPLRLYLGHRLTKQQMFMRLNQYQPITLDRILVYNRRMYIQREHYLHLLKQAEQLTSQNQVLLHENALLAHELQRQKIASFELMQRFTHMEAEMAVYTQQIMRQNEAHHCDIKGNMIKLNQQQNQLLQSKFNHLQTSSFQKYKVLQIKNRVNRIENHELVTFLHKIKKVYQTNSQASEEPSLKDLAKWIKTLAAAKKQKELGDGKTSKPKQQTCSSWKENRKAKN